MNRLDGPCERNGLDGQAAQHEQKGLDAQHAQAAQREQKGPDGPKEKEGDEGKQQNKAQLLKELIEQAAAQGTSKIHLEITHIDSISGDYIKCSTPDQIRRKELKSEREELALLTREEAKLFARFKDLEVMRGCISYVTLAYNTDDLSELIVAFCERYGVSTSCHDLWTRELIHLLRPFCVHIMQDFKSENICRTLKHKFSDACASSFDSLPD